MRKRSFWFRVNIFGSVNCSVTLDFQRINVVWGKRVSDKSLSPPHDLSHCRTDGSAIRLRPVFCGGGAATLFIIAVLKIEKLQRATVLADLFRVRISFFLGRRGRPAGSTVATSSGLKVRQTHREKMSASEPKRQ